ncbi:hypothetical protein JCM8115_006973 [Rhodotorula mucilaginosa]
MGSLNLSPPASDRDIPRLVADSFQDSIDMGYIHLYAATSDHPYRVTDDPPRFPQFGHVVHQLRDKPAVPPTTPDLSKRREKDVLQGPDYGKGEKILQLEQGGLTYSLVHNLHALFPEHMMAIPYFGDKGPFRPQTSDLLPQDLYLAWRVVNAYAHAGRETTMFFNGGPLAGASQPHLHMQFCPFQYGSPPGPEALARSLSSSDDDRDADTANADRFTPAPRLPLPWTQFYLPLPRPATAHNGSPTSEELYNIYTRLLRTSREYIASIESSESSESDGGADDNENNRARVPPSGPKRDSYNLFLTSQHMHLVPRTDRLVALERDDHPRGDGGDDLLRISLNGLVYLGYWHVPSEEDWDLLVRKAGLGRVLQRAAYINEQYQQQTA